MKVKNLMYIARQIEKALENEGDDFNGVAIDLTLDFDEEEKKHSRLCEVILDFSASPFDSEYFDYDAFNDDFVNSFLVPLLPKFVVLVHRSYGEDEARALSDAKALDKAVHGTVFAFLQRYSDGGVKLSLRRMGKNDREGYVKTLAERQARREKNG